LHGKTAATESDPDDHAKYNARVALVTQHLAERWRDVAFGEESGRYLIEQRLEQVVVGTAVFSSEGHSHALDTMRASY
jgi:hypothetical protein